MEPEYSLGYFLPIFLCINLNIQKSQYLVILRNWNIFSDIFSKYFSVQISISKYSGNIVELKCSHRYLSSNIFLNKEYYSLNIFLSKEYCSLNTFLYKSQYIYIMKYHLFLLRSLRYHSSNIFLKKIFS